MNAANMGEAKSTAILEAPLGIKPNAGHVRAAVRAYFGENHAVLFEVGNSTGHTTNRHIDAIAMGLWPSRGMHLHGIEIKVSRSDWKRELDDHAKADAVQRYCDHWWIAAPKGLIPPAELPTTWGLLELADSKLRIKVQAPKLEAVPLTKAFVAAMLRRAARIDSEELGAALEAATVKIKADERARFERDWQSRHDQAAKVLTKVEDVKARTSIDLLDWFPSEQVVQVIQFALQQRSLFTSYGQLQLLRDQCSRLVERIDTIQAPGADPE